MPQVNCPAGAALFMPGRSSGLGAIPARGNRDNNRRLLVQASKPPSKPRPWAVHVEDQAPRAETCSRDAQSGLVSTPNTNCWGWLAWSVAGGRMKLGREGS